jgi:hypothetical protein
VNKKSYLYYISMLCYSCNMSNVEPRMETGSMAAKDGYALGFVLGQVSVYLEQVRTGAKLAAQLGCSTVYVDEIVKAVDKDGCQFAIEDRTAERVAVWIFKEDFVRTLITELGQNATPPTAAGVWAMGKLFGYSDAAIGPYLHEHGLIKSASGEESSQRPFADKNDLRKEPTHCAC